LARSASSSHGLAENAARAAALIAMFCGQTALVYVERSPDRPLWHAPAPTRTALVLGAFSLASLALAIAVPPFALLLHLAAPPLSVAFAAAGIGTLATLWWEPFKW
jgi:hypothetical protein